MRRLGVATMCAGRSEEANGGCKFRAMLAKLASWYHHIAFICRQRSR